MHDPNLPDVRELRDLVNAEQLGKEVQQFKQGKVWRYMLACAEAERDEAIAELVTCPANDTERIRTLQSTIQRAESMDAWLEEALANGIVAAAQLNAAEAEEQP